MGIKIAVDATPIVSALIGGISRTILFDRRFNFISTEYTFNEIKKYLTLISKKSGVPEMEIVNALKLLPIKIYSSKHYKDKLRKSGKIMKKVDKKDIDILALSIKENCHLWSEDKHFRRNEINLIRTKDLI